jgi:hypothetical protein
MPMHITPDNIKTNIDDFEIGLSTATVNDTVVPVAVLASQGHMLALYLPELEFLIEELVGLRTRLKERVEQELSEANQAIQSEDKGIETADKPLPSFNAK